MNYFIKTSFLIILGIIVGTTQTCAQQEFKRNIEMRTFIPKGQWIVGSSVSYSQYSNDNYQFLVIENLSGEGYAFKVSPVLCYAFKDNVAAGGRFMYSRTYTKLNNISVNIDEDTNFDISNLYELKNSYSGIAVLRNYGEFYQFNLSSCIRQQNSLTAQFVSFSLANLANIFYPPRFLQ